MKLPSGKKIKIRKPTQEELKNFSLPDFIMGDAFEPLVEISRCEKCGNLLKININE